MRGLIMSAAALVFVGGCTAPADRPEEEETSEEISQATQSPPQMVAPCRLSKWDKVYWAPPVGVSWSLQNTGTRTCPSAYVRTAIRYKDNGVDRKLSGDLGEFSLGPGMRPITFRPADPCGGSWGTVGTGARCVITKVVLQFAYSRAAPWQPEVEVYPGPTMNDIVGL
jgi:hypothetical protein